MCSITSPLDYLLVVSGIGILIGAGATWLLNRKNDMYVSGCPTTPEPKDEE